MAESTVGVFGRKAKRLSKAAEAVQEALGHHQDQVLFRRFLSHAEAHLTFDAQERRTIALMSEAWGPAVDADWKDVRQALEDVDRKSLRSWMR